MTDVIKAAILGVIEGLTEFLPVSSTGHMILAEPLLGIKKDAPPWQAFLYFIQIGAILAVIVYFQRSLRRSLLRLPTDGWSNHLAAKLAVAFVPAAIVGLALHHTLEKYLEHPVPIAIALILGAGIMEWIERGHRKGTTATIDAITLRQALFIGIAQCISVVPGTSRAMATIMGGMLVGLSPQLAAEFSFFLAIPTLLAAGSYSLLKHRAELHANEATLLGVGFVTAFVVALLVVEGFMRFVQNHRLRPFAVYRVVLGAAVLLAWKFGWMT